MTTAILERLDQAILVAIANPDKNPTNCCKRNVILTNALTT